VADTTRNVLEQTATRFLVTVTRAVIEVDSGRTADVEGSWQTKKGTVQHLPPIKFSPAICIQVVFPCCLGKWKKSVVKNFKKQ
jgi:hypothetical protein